MKFNYPNFEPRMGNLTKKIIKEYLIEHIKNGLFDEDILLNENITGLIASNDPNDKIYFWQIYSIIGSKPIYILIRRFYENIFNDNDAPWFRDEFIEAGDIEYHIRGQHKFWLDVMGGGCHYEGGERKLKIKHKFVKNIMSTSGAERWMFNMEKTINELNYQFIDDKRIIPCINNFLNFFMKKYAFEFDFNLYDILDKKNSKL